MQAAREEQRAQFEAQKNGYGSDLRYQQDLSAEKHRREIDEDREAFQRAKGLTFECYTRDQIVAQERKATTDFQKQQQAEDSAKKAGELAERRALPPGFLTAEKQA